MVERGAVNADVAGSSPASSAKSEESWGCVLFLGIAMLIIGASLLWGPIALFVGGVFFVVIAAIGYALK
jgi:hypothetical protein